MKQILKYSNEIDWDYNFNSNENLRKKFLNIRSYKKSKNDKKDSRDYKNITSDINNDFHLNNYKNRFQKNIDLRYKNSNGTKVKKASTSVAYYGLLFTFVFGFLFFLAISISSASPIKKQEYSESNIYNIENSTKLLEEHLFKIDKSTDAEENPNHSLVSKVTYFNYRVKKNDSFEKIAKKFDLSLDTIYLVNDINKKTILKIGKVLVIPNQDGRVISVKKNDSIFKLASRYGIRWERIVDANNLESSIIFPGMKLFIPGSKMTNYEKSQFNVLNFIWPIRGKITSYFGPRIDPITGIYGFHSGIDIKNHKGTPTKSCSDGKVIFVGWQKVYGNFVMIRHNNNMISIYAHLNSIDVEKNQYIKQGESVGTVGSSGRSTGSHLHFELRKDDKPIDPLNYLP